jgi:hypothetical protein
MRTAELDDLGCAENVIDGRNRSKSVFVVG